MIKKFFSTPKVPIRFYIDDGIVLFIIYQLWSLNSPLFGSIGMKILKIVWLILSIYSYGWFCDYMLYSRPGRFVNLLFQKSTIFSKNTVAEYGFVYLRSTKYLENSDYYHGYVQRSTFGEDVVQYTLFVTAFRAFRVAILAPLILISPFLHISTMKKYREKIQNDRDNLRNKIFNNEELSEADYNSLFFDEVFEEYEKISQKENEELYRKMAVLDKEIEMSKMN